MHEIIEATILAADPVQVELDRKENEAAAKAQAKTAADKANARQAVLDRLGITADEAALLLG